MNKVNVSNDTDINSAVAAGAIGAEMANRLGEYKDSESQLRDVSEFSDGDTVPGQFKDG